MRIQKVSNSTSARPGPEHIPVGLTSECDRLKLEIEQLNERLRVSITDNEKLEVELDEAHDLIEKLKIAKKSAVVQRDTPVKCTDCKEIIEDPLCQSCLNECQRIDDDSGGD
jgi:chaperonin cofactor prefoldin